MENRYCIAKDCGKWRLYDQFTKKFAEAMEKASDKASAMKRMDIKNKEVCYDG